LSVDEKTGGAKRGRRPRGWNRREPIEEYEALCQGRIADLVEVHEPLVLISQVQRSGGTLLSQLFDGHPECHAHPWDLEIGHPRNWHWPPIDLSAPSSWFEVLYEGKVDIHLRKGYSKQAADRDPDVFAFGFLPRLQKAIFDHCITSRRIVSRRDVLDCYFTSYFNAWLDNHNLYTGPKKVTTGLAPMLSMEAGNVEQFFEAYPDGTLVSIVREPRAWFASAQPHSKRFADLEAALGLWCRSAEAMIEAGDRHGDRVVILTYENLVQETEATMRQLAGRLGISVHPALLIPTFNLRAIRANSSQRTDRYGILLDRTTAYRGLLDPVTIERVERLAGDLYDRVAERALGGAG
jgi:hypothetical protein